MNCDASLLSMAYLKKIMIQSLQISIVLYVAPSGKCCWASNTLMPKSIRAWSGMGPHASMKTFETIPFGPYITFHVYFLFTSCDCSTFTNDSEFAQRVPEDQLVRVLNAFVHELVHQNIVTDIVLNKTNDKCRRHHKRIRREVNDLNIATSKE